MIRNTILFAAAALLGLAPSFNSALADEAKAAAALNVPLQAVADSNKSWKTVLQACADATVPPIPVGAEFGPLAIWPGMSKWAEVRAWAAANPGMGQALLAAQKAYIFGCPYGRANVPPNFAEKGICVTIGDGANMFVTNPSYLQTLDLTAAYATAEMYRLGEEKKFDAAFELGLAALRLWRQVADQQLLEEKRHALETMCELCSMQRDFMYTFLNEIPKATIRRAALDGFPFVRPADAERLRRLEMPEGDRVVAEIALVDMFDAQGQADRAKFVALLSPLQSRTEPLTQFGASRRWESVAEVHGSLDATKAKVTSIYDDWWRRWRVRYFDPLLDNPTALSKTNTVRYAMVMLLAKDLESVFVLRKRLNAELNGTVLAAGLCAWHSELGSWPRSMDQAYTQYVRKRFDYDPFDPKYGRWHYESLSTPKTIDYDTKRLEVSGALLYALGLDRDDAGGLKASSDGLTGDFVAWPPLRAVERMKDAPPAPAAPAAAPAAAAAPAGKPPVTPPAKGTAPKTPAAPK